MAKAKPLPTLAEMESKLGYKVDSLAYADESSKRFYSNLRLVPKSTYDRTMVEFEEYEKKTYREGKRPISEKVLPELVATIVNGDDVIILTRWNYAGLYNFTVDIRHGYGFDMSLLFTSDEASRVLSVAKLQPNPSDNANQMFFKLPREVRDKIYTFALPMGKWQIGDMEKYDELSFAGSIGDPSGFYFPLSSELGVLRVNRQMRQEAIALAYRRTVFHLDDTGDLTQLLIAIGRIGRDNLESLELSWESRADSELKWDESPDRDDLFLRLPSLHAAICVQLLKQCKRLRFLRLYFDSDVIINLTPNAFKTDPSIRELCSIRGIESVQIWDLGHEPIEQYEMAKWLKGMMESPWEERANEKEFGTRECNQ